MPIQKIYETLLVRATIFLVIVVVMLLVHTATRTNTSYSRSVAKEQRLDLWTRVIDNTRSAVVLCDGTGKILDWNAGAEYLTDIKKEQAVGKNIADFMPIGLSERHRTCVLAKDKLRKLANGHVLEVYGCTLLDKTKNEHIVDVRITGVYNANVNKPDYDILSSLFVAQITPAVKLVKIDATVKPVQQ